MVSAGSSVFPLESRESLYTFLHPALSPDPYELRLLAPGIASRLSVAIGQWEVLVGDQMVSGGKAQGIYSPHSLPEGM